MATQYSYRIFVKTANEFMVSPRCNGAANVAVVAPTASSTAAITVSE